MAWVVAVRSLILGFVVILSGCVVANTFVDPYTNLRFEARGNLNPDRTDRPSPVVVRVYELRSPETFASAGFFDLYDEAAGVLEKDLLSSSELVIRPGLVYVHEMRLDSKARHIGIVVAFQDIDEADWKLLLDAQPRGYNNITIELDDRALRRVHN